ncbi:MAG TPA: diguanylate cyclase, partial [Afipia sp.]
VVAALETAVATAQPYRCRYRVPEQGKRVRWVIASGKPAFDDDGKLSRLLGIVVDVTDQMETAVALAESQFQFQTLTEALPQIVWSCDAEGRHDYFSERWSEFTGIPREAITEETWKQLVHPKDWQMVSRVWNESRLCGKPYDLDYRFRHHSGEYRWLRVMALPIRGDNGQITRWFGTSTDIHEAYLVAEERKALARELERIATQDQLTEVLTRRAFIERANASIVETTRNGKPTSLLMLDIDYFKSVNDTYGHPGGDKVLATVAKRMKGALKRQDIIGRMGGEEFAVLLSGCTPRKALNVAERIRLAVETSPVCIVGGVELTITVSVGATTCLSPDHDLDAMLGIADKALYQAKASGRNRSIFCGQEAIEHC